MPKLASAAEVVALVKSSHRVFVHGAAATPNVLLDALLARASELENVELIHLHTYGKAAYADDAYAKSFRVANLFVGENLRSRVGSDRVDYLPCFLSEIPALFREKRRRLDVALLHLSPPDRHGNCTLGTSVDVARAAADSADILLAQINVRMPRCHGDSVVRLDDLDAWVEVDEPLPVCEVHEPSTIERAIGRNAASLIEDGATLQMGIGAIPDAVLDLLHDRRHLGIHTEMWSDGALRLIRSGAVDGSRKKTHPGRIVSGFVSGSSAVYEYLDDNPETIQLDIAYVNNPGVIARNPKVVAINSAVEIDLTGQVCADSVGHHIISGVGGQMDFLRGASLSEGGKPILALPSRTKRDEPRIVPTLKPGAGVVTTRSHVHYVVTEQGVADLHGKTLNERAAALISISHPDDRETLERAWRDVRAKIG